MNDEEVQLERQNVFVHGNNIKQKIGHRKYNDQHSQTYIAEISARYEAWKKANEDLCGPFKTITDGDDELLTKRVKLFADYKDFIDQQHYAEKFDSRSNLHSSVLEEFMYFLFKDLLLDFELQACSHAKQYII